MSHTFPQIEWPGPHSPSTRLPVVEFYCRFDEISVCRGHDVFNALDIFENSKFLKDLKFGIGDGRLRYYLYNWRVAQGLEASQVGLVLL